MSRLKPKTDYFIAGDWGTSNLRLYLCECLPGSRATLLATRYGTGVIDTHGDFEDTLFSLTQDWLDQYGATPIILAGMVGSNIGWKQAPYISSPINIKRIIDGRVAFSRRGIEISILAGIKTKNLLQSPDVMRGEELQLLGWQQLNSADNSGARLFALPGTHNKWVLVRDGTIETFLTAFTGELFGLLSVNSILVSGDAAPTFSIEAFKKGLSAIKNSSTPDLIHILFSTRSRQVLGEITSSDAPSYLSGLIIGTDVAHATKLFNQHSSSALPISVIGEPALTERYLLALNYFDLVANDCDPAKIAIAGFEVIHKHLHQS